jgi:5-methylcytosine-specific restriction protein A
VPHKPISYAQLMAAQRGDSARVASDREYSTRRRSDPLQVEADRLRSSGRWKRLRLVKLSRDPVCEECLRHDVTEPAVDVDHEIPVVELLAQGRREAAFDLEALNSLCRACHCKKTAREVAARASANKTSQLPSSERASDESQSSESDVAIRFSESAQESTQEAESRGFDGAMQ